MTRGEEREVERIYSVPELVAKLRRLADALEGDKPFRIQIAGERIWVPVRAQFSIAHERDGDEEEIEFQFTWSLEPTDSDELGGRLGRRPGGLSPAREVTGGAPAIARCPTCDRSLGGRRAGRRRRSRQWICERQSAGTRPGGPGVPWSSGCSIGGASSGPSYICSSR